MSNRSFEELAGQILKWTVVVTLLVAVGIGVFEEHLPPLQYWLEVTPLAYLTALVVSVILGLMGVEMKKYPKVHTYSLMGLIAVALFLGAWSSAKQAEDAAKLTAKLGILQKEIREVSGKDAYAYIHSQNGRKKRGKFLMHIKSVGKASGVYIGVHLIDSSTTPPQKLPQHQIKMDLVGQNTVFPYALPAGEWAIDFVGPTDWTQLLLLTEKDGRLIQTMGVHRAGEAECLHCPEPIEFEVQDVSR